MNIEKTRLLSLIEFAQQSARMRNKVASTVAEHRLFALYEHQMRGLPGIRSNPGGGQGDDEVWLSVERLHEMKAPEITSRVLLPWVRMTPSPNEEPSLREAVDGEPN